jgi:hypothetical protein
LTEHKTYDMIALVVLPPDHPTAKSRIIAAKRYYCVEALMGRSPGLSLARYPPFPQDVDQVSRSF